MSHSAQARDTLATVRGRYRTDCRYFKGEKPCGYAEECQPCDSYAPMGYRVLVIKRAAIGDVLRTTPILVPLHATHDPCHVTWVTDPGAAELLRTTAEIDRLLPFSPDLALTLAPESFDLLICLDKEPRATALATLIRADEKRGFGMSPQGTLTIWNPEAEYAYRLGLSDTLKFRENRRTYQEIALLASGLPQAPVPPYLFSVTEAERSEAQSHLSRIGAAPGERLLGLNTGCGPVFATKKWTEDGYASLAARLLEDKAATPVLLGGPDERERNARIGQRLKERGARVLDAGCDRDLRSFAAIVASLDGLVTGDTLALHLAIAARVPVLCIMGSTSATEIELYGRGRTLVTDFPCAPCYLRECPLPISCMEAMPVDAVYEAAREILTRERAGVAAP